MNGIKKIKFGLFNGHQYAGLIWLSAVLPMLIMLVVWCFMGVFPFGDKTLMAVDFGQQYIGLYGFLRHTILNGDWSGLFYSFSKSIGGPMLGVWGFNLISPFNLFYIVLPLSEFKWAVFFSIWFRYGAMGASMATLFVKRYKPSNSLLWAIPVMATAYTLSGMIVSYQANPIFYDAMICLPLVILGLEEMLDGGRPYRYILFLSSSLFLHFYMGYMICLFVALYSCYYVFSHQQKTDGWKSYVLAVSTRLGKAVGYSILAVGCVFFLLYPIFLSLLASKGSYNSGMVFDWSLQINPLDILSKLMLGGFDNETSWGYGPNLPNIFVGALSLVGFLLYMALADVSRRQKVMAGVVTLVFFLSLTHEFTSKIWHMGQNPAGFFYRFSWIISFFMVLLAYQTLQSTKRLKDKGVLAMLVLAVLAAGYVYTHVTEYSYLSLTQPYLLTSFITRYSLFIFFGTYLLVAGWCYLFLYRKNSTKDDQLPTIGLCLLVTALLLYLAMKGYLFSQIFLTLLAWVLAIVYFYKRPQQKWIHYLVILLTSLELGYNAYLSQVTMGYDQSADFTNATETMGELIDTIKDDGSEDDFYRVASTIRYSYNDPFLHSYSGLSTFSSNLEESTLQLFGYLGSMGGNASTFYGNGTPLTDSLFDVRYFIEMKEYTQDFVDANPDLHIFGRIATRSDLPENYTQIYDDDRFILYKNDQVFSIAFGVPKAIGEVQLKAHHATDNQTSILQALSGDTTKEYYELYSLGEPTVANMEPVEEEGKALYRRTDSSQKGSLTFRFTPETDDTYYLFVPTTFRKVGDVSINLSGARYHYAGLFDQAQLFTLFTCQGGQEQTLEFQTGESDEIDLTNVVVARADDTAIQSVLASQQSQQMVIDSWSNTRITGQVTIEGDQQMMLTSIPYDEGWSVTVDGQAVKTKKALTSLLSFPITSGEHTISMTFTPRGWWIGLSVSGLSLVITVGLWLTHRRKNTL